MKYLYSYTSSSRVIMSMTTVLLSLFYCSFSAKNTSLVAIWPPSRATTSTERWWGWCCSRTGHIHAPGLEDYDIWRCVCSVRDRGGRAAVVENTNEDRKLFLENDLNKWCDLSALISSVRLVALSGWMDPTGAMLTGCQGSPITQQMWRTVWRC